MGLDLKHELHTEISDILHKRGEKTASCWIDQAGLHGSMSGSTAVKAGSDSYKGMTSVPAGVSAC